MGHRSSVPLFWRLKGGKYNLTGSKCHGCDIFHFPPRKLCNRCGKPLADHALSGFGCIKTYTIIHAAPGGFEDIAPYAIVIVELAEGPMVSGILVDRVGIEIGKKVRTVFRKIFEDGKDGIIHYGFKFELLE